MKIKINLKIILFLILLAITRQIKIYALLMFFAFLHELGHIIAGITLGLKPESITIIPTGFFAKFKEGIQSPKKKLLVAFAGPLVNLIIILITRGYIAVTNNSEIYSIEIQKILYSNLLIFIFNMIPIYPLDGGRIVKESLEILYGALVSYELTNKISNVVVIILTIFSSLFILKYNNITVVVVLVYLWLLVIEENKNYPIKKHWLEEYVSR